VVDFCENYDGHFCSIKARNCLKDLSQDWHFVKNMMNILINKSKELSQRSVSGLAFWEKCDEHFG